MQTDRQSLHKAASWACLCTRGPGYALAGWLSLPKQPPLHQTRTTSSQHPACPLHALRKLPQSYTRVSAGNYALSGLVGFQMFQKTVGVIGTGAIGTEAVRILKVRRSKALNYKTALQGQTNLQDKTTRGKGYRRRSCEGAAQRQEPLPGISVHLLHVTCGCCHDHSDHTLQQLETNCLCWQLTLLRTSCLQGIGCNVIAHDLYPNPAVSAMGVKYMDLEELLPLCDIVTLHCPLLQSTANIINKKR